MLQQDSFQDSELTKIDWQYSITHESTVDFALNEAVFLKSNPSLQLKVTGYEGAKIVCSWHDKHGVEHTDVFPPQCILQYKWAAFKSHEKSGADICLN